jgi:protein-L-isoaspartate(D-aspartate) O-methyltransferase
VKLLMKKMISKKRNLLKHLKNKGFSEKLLHAFESVEREKFVPEEYQDLSYEDVALPIGYDQTISQPYTIAFMLRLLNVVDGEKVLEVGSGSGYVLSLLSELNPKGKIFGIERIEELVKSSTSKLREYQNVEVIHSDGSVGFEKESPFDKILVSASAENIPEELIEQLKIGGTLVIPVKQSIYVLKKQKEGNEITEYEGFVFVPLLRE